MLTTDFGDQGGHISNISFIPVHAVQQQLPSMAYQTTLPINWFCNQYNAACLITRKMKSDYIGWTLIGLDQLPIRALIQYKVLLLTFKSQHKVAPEYLVDLLEPYLPAQSFWSEQQHKLDQPKARTKKYGDRAISVCAPNLWNELPIELNEADTVEKFKSQLKTYCLRLYMMCKLLLEFWVAMLY